MTEFMRNAEFWREQRKPELKADGYRLAESDKQRLLKVAAEYEQLADRAEQWKTVAEVGTLTYVTAGFFIPP